MQPPRATSGCGSSRAPRSRQALLLFFAVLPFWSNYLIRTYAWIVLLNREGLIVNIARAMGYHGELPQMLYTEGAVITGLVYNYLPFVILAAYAPLSRLNPEIAEASRDLGATALASGCISSDSCVAEGAQVATPGGDDRALGDPPERAPRDDVAHLAGVDSLSG